MSGNKSPQFFLENEFGLRKIRVIFLVCVDSLLLSEGAAGIWVCIVRRVRIGIVNFDLIRIQLVSSVF